MITLGAALFLAGSLAAATPTASATASATPTPSPTPACLLGGNPYLYSSYVGSGSLSGTRISANAGTVSYIWAYNSGGPGQIAAALYANSSGGPTSGAGPFIVASANVASNRGWTVCPVTPTAISGGLYWLVFRSSGSVRIGGQSNFNPVTAISSDQPETFPDPLYGSYSEYSMNLFISECGGGIFTATPTPTHTPVVSPTPTITPTITRTVTPTRTVTASFSASPSFTGSPTITCTFTATPSPLPTAEIIPGQAFAYPNPARVGSAVTLRFEPAASAQVTLFDLAGRALVSPNLSVDAPRGLAVWRTDRDRQAPGLYFVRVALPQGLRRLRLVLSP